MTLCAPVAGGASGQLAEALSSTSSWWLSESDATPLSLTPTASLASLAKDRYREGATHDAASPWTASGNCLPSLQTTRGLRCLVEPRSPRKVDCGPNDVSRWTSSTSTGAVLTASTYASLLLSLPNAAATEALPAPTPSRRLAALTATTPALVEVMVDC